MKRSRLRMFKVTSMTISIMGIVLIVATVGILAYLGFESLSSFISADATSSTAHDELVSLKNDYSSLKMEYDNVKRDVEATNDKDLKIAYTNAEMELVKTNQAITDVESAITVGKPSEEVDKRIQVAKTQLEEAKSSLTNVRSQM
ncbi:MAG: hypothetical protein QM396_04175 [Euryarchaeota archaeon]|jgi:archaellum component FlaC|uniref:hypothetical protein n=1 Tax=Methanobacterium sp. MZD130B TaxID=3394378 RepID=UPI0039FC8B36|nr:hypothetical protein [Euryarchaeota archaeon]